jgi:hypothetical protein
MLFPAVCEVSYIIKICLKYIWKQIFYVHSKPNIADKYILYKAEYWPTKRAFLSLISTICDEFPMGSEDFDKCYKRVEKLYSCMDGDSRFFPVHERSCPDGALIATQQSPLTITINS